MQNENLDAETNTPNAADPARGDSAGNNRWLVAGAVLLSLAVAVFLLFVGLGDGSDNDDSTGSSGSNRVVEGRALEGALDSSGIPSGSLLYVDRSGSEANSGRVVVVKPDGTQLLLNRRCIRVATAAETGACHDVFGPELPEDFMMRYFDPGTGDLATTSERLAIFPGRIDVSSDGAFVATSTWVVDVGYRATIERRSATAIDIVADDLDPVPLESFTVLPVEDYHSDPQARFWAVTFDPDNDTFWTTAIFGGRPEIMRGTMSQRFLEPTGILGIEPAISPDGSTLVVVDRAGALIAHFMDNGVPTGDSVALGETGPIEDQPVWLDNDTVLYVTADDGRPPDEVRLAQDPSATFTIWSLDVREDADPVEFLRGADAPWIHPG